MTKIVLLGHTQSGKSQLLNRLVNNKFIEHAEPTIGAGYSYWYPFGIWDVSGDLHYSSLYHCYLLNSQTIIFLVDLSNLSNQKHIDFFDSVNPIWLNGANLILVGNKKDVIPVDESSFLEVKTQIENKLGKKFDNYFMTSAKTGEGVQELKAQLLSSLTLQESNSSHLENSKQSLQDKHSKLIKIAISVAIGVMVAIVVGLIGFGIGCATGIFLGPMALVSGSASAIALVSASLTAGVAVGTLSFFHKENSYTETNYNTNPSY